MKKKYLHQYDKEGLSEIDCYQLLKYKKISGLTDSEPMEVILKNYETM